MNSDIVATPFGRRAVSYGQLARQFASQTVDPRQSVDKWKLFRRICEARTTLGVSDRSLSVLNALLSFYPKTELSEEHGLIVFPSNEQLSLRAHGMSEQTIRRHIAALVDAGLILRKDSPNGKRYARKSRAGGISDAYGFSLAPLLSRVAEIEDIAETLAEERLQLQRLREKISLIRRDILKFIELLALDGQAGALDLLKARYSVVTSRLDRKTKAPFLTHVLEELSEIRDELAKFLENQLEMQKTSGNAYQNERLIQNSESESHLEKANHVHDENEQSSPASVDGQTLTNPSGTSAINKNQFPRASKESFDLQTVLKACPDISHYGPNGSVRTWNDLRNAANVVKNMLSISQSAYDEAQMMIGMEETNTIIACILQRGEHIASAGGYLRSLTNKKKAHAFSIKPMLMALLRSRMSVEVKLEPRAG